MGRNPVELIVEIAKGVNDATESEYRAKNRLVIKGIFGFDNGDGTAQFSSPEQMISDGIWPDEQSANKNYGPKWFLEIDENEQAERSGRFGNSGHGGRH